MVESSSDVMAPPVETHTVSIDLSQANRTPPYDIVIGDNLFANAGELIGQRLSARRCLIVTDTNIAPLYLKRLEAVLDASGHTLLPSVTLPAGESSKDYVNLHVLLNRILAAGIDRSSLIIALGGGVVGDLAGLAASLAMRGIDIVQMPTTLLAQVDSSVGGKTGINTDAGKNTVGTFYQPRLVIIDVSALDSLPLREMRAGYAEIVKYGLIKDAAFFNWCRAHAGKLLNGDRAAQIHAIAASCNYKAQVVMADEREAGERALLNLGHTFGHAMESATGFSNALMHGEAVAIGMVMAFRLSAQLGLCSHTESYDVRDHIASVGLPVKPPALACGVDQLMALMAQDKKAVAGKLTLVLARGIGKAFVAKDVRETEVRAVWAEFL